MPFMLCFLFSECISVCELLCGFTHVKHHFVILINSEMFQQEMKTFLKNTVFIVVIMCLMYNPLQNTKRFAFHILLQV